MYQLQLALNLIDLFTSQPKIDFYTTLFSNLDLSPIPESPLLNLVSSTILAMLSKALLL